MIFSNNSIHSAGSRDQAGRDLTWEFFLLFQRGTGTCFRSTSKRSSIHLDCLPQSNISKFRYGYFIEKRVHKVPPLAHNTENTNTKILCGYHTVLMLHCYLLSTKSWLLWTVLNTKVAFLLVHILPPNGNVTKCRLPIDPII